MSSESEQFVALDIITDDDVGMYQIGEITGSFDTDKLKQYLQQHKLWGRDQLLGQLNFLIYQVMATAREIEWDEHGVAVSS